MRGRLEKLAQVLRRSAYVVADDLATIGRS
jgi:hypothetical protein